MAIRNAAGTFRRAAVLFAARIAANHDVRLLNPNRLSAESPPNQRLDVKALNQSGFPFQFGHTDALAALMARLLAPAPPLKGLITDLDDTLWAGILGDVGVDGVAWDWIGTRRSTGFSSRRCKVLRILGCWRVWPIRTIRIWFTDFRTLGYPLRADSVFPIQAHWRPKSESVEVIL